MLMPRDIQANPSLHLQQFWGTMRGLEQILVQLQSRTCIPAPKVLGNAWLLSWWPSAPSWVQAELDPRRIIHQSETLPVSSLHTEDQTPGYVDASESCNDASIAVVIP